MTISDDGPSEASLWDVFEISTPHAAREGDKKHLGLVVGRLTHQELGKLGHWIDENKEEAIRWYGPARWHDISTFIHVAAFFSRPNLSARNVTHTREGSNMFLRARKLVRRPRRVSVSWRDAARRLGVPKTWFFEMRDRAERLGFPLDGPSKPIPMDVLSRILRGGQRGPSPK